MQNKRIVFNESEYTLLYKHSAGSFHWTKAYRMDTNHHVQLLQLFEEQGSSHKKAETMHLHISDLKRIMLDILALEI